MGPHVATTPPTMSDVAAKITFFTVVTESEVESLAAWEGGFSEVMNRPWMEEWFARMVPLVETGDPARPVEVRPDANGAYRVGVSPVWRVGKKMLGLYLPLRFRNGLPFHSGAPWKAMELGLKGMSATLARR